MTIKYGKYSINIFNITSLKVKSKSRTVLIRDKLFADDAALAAHSEGQLQSPMNRFYKACDRFSLTMGLNEIQRMYQGTAIPPQSLSKTTSLRLSSSLPT